MKDNRDLNVMQLEAKAYVARLLQEFDMMMQGARAQRGEQWQEEATELKQPTQSTQLPPI